MRLKVQKASSKLSAGKKKTVKILKEKPYAKLPNQINASENNLSEKKLQLKTLSAEKSDNIFKRHKFLYEDIEKRGQNVKHYISNNGTATAVFSNYALHYFDSSEGIYKEIDKSFALKSNNDFSADFSKKTAGGRLKLLKKGCAVNITLGKILKKKHIKYDKKGKNKFPYAANEITLNNVNKNTDIKYFISSGKIEENIIIRRKSDSYEYDFVLNTDKMYIEKSQDGSSIQLINKKNGEVLFKIHPSVMTDAKGKNSGLVFYDIRKQRENIYNFKIKADAEWVNAEDRAFPVIIRPSIVSEGASFFMRKNYTRASSSQWTESINSAGVKYPDSTEYKSDLNIKKELLNLDGCKISKAVLSMRPKSGEGYFIIGGTKKYLSPGIKAQVDITDKVLSGNLDIEILSDSGCFVQDIPNLINPGTIDGPDRIWPVLPDCNFDDFIKRKPLPHEKPNIHDLHLPHRHDFFEVKPIPLPDDIEVSLEVEYLTNDDSVPAEENFAFAGGTEGTLNLATGELVAAFTDTVLKSSALSCKISHVYKKSDKDYGCGRNWRLNLHQTLVKNKQGTLHKGVDYIYTDGDGQRHGFMETYYYLGEKDNKIVVEKDKVTVELDGSLWYKTEKGNCQVYKEQRTATGMKLSARLEDFKNIEFLEQRTKEQRELEEYIKSYGNNLKEYVIVDYEKGNIANKGGLERFFIGNILSIDGFRSFMSQSLGKMILPESEAIQYRSLLLQREQLEKQLKVYDGTFTVQKEALQNQKSSLANQKQSLNNNKESLGINLSSLDKNLNSLQLQEISLQTTINALENNKKSLQTQIQTLRLQQTAYELQLEDLKGEQKNNTESKKNHIGKQKDHIENQISCLYAQGRDICSQQNNNIAQKKFIEPQKSDINNQIKNIKCQMDNLAKQLADLTNQERNIEKQIKNLADSVLLTQIQKNLVEEQKNYILKKSQVRRKELQKLFKEYVNMSFELKKLKEKTPYAFLSNGEVNLYFNEFGNLCEIGDSYDNSIRIEYDNNGRISKVYDGNRAAILKYNYYGQLASITDYRGRKAEYLYSSSEKASDLLAVKYSDGNTLSFSYGLKKTIKGTAVIQKNYLILNSLYSERNIRSIHSSFDKTNTVLSYANGRLVSIINKSEIDGIADGSVHYVNKLQVVKRELFQDAPLLSKSKDITISEINISYGANECIITTDGAVKSYIMDKQYNLIGSYSKLTDGTFKDRLSYTYFDRKNRWCYCVKETGNPISLPKRLEALLQTGRHIRAESVYDLTKLLFKNISGKKHSFLGQMQKKELSKVLHNPYSEIIAFPVGKRVGSIFASITPDMLPAGQTEFMFSAYAAAPKAPVTDMCYKTAFHPWNSKRSSEKFEITAEVNYNGGKTRIFTASFDYKNDGKQFCALPVTLDKSALKDLKNIVLKYVYTGNDGSEFTDFRFAPCEWEYKTFDEFKNLKYSENSMTLLNSEDSGNSYRKLSANYTYDVNQMLIKKEVTGVDSIPGKKDKKTYAVSKYYYNDLGRQVRKENYIEGEENTTGVMVEETVYDKKGRKIKDIIYNTLDSTSKQYTEKEYLENGQLSAKIDVTGENKTVFEYEPGTDNVITEIEPGGSRFSYGRDYFSGEVTGITQSTDKGEGNSVETKYTCGVVTHLKSGLNTVNYEYDGKRRKTAVFLNGEKKVEYGYEENVLSEKMKINNIDFDSLKSDKTKTILKGSSKLQDIIVETVNDKRGNLISTAINNEIQTVNRYDADGTLLQSADNITGRVLKTDYDKVNKRSSATVTTAGTKNNYEYLPEVSEKYYYNETGGLKERIININGAETQKYIYEYKDDAGHNLKSVILPNGLFYKPMKNFNGRYSGKIFERNGDRMFGEYVDYLKAGDHSTGLISSIKYGSLKDGRYVISEGLGYKYDKCSNISEIWKNGKLVVAYTYDKLKRLIREDNKAFGKSWFYSYDNNGNIMSKREADYTKKSADEIDKYNYEKQYFYDGDKLMNIGEEKFAYDVFGNPVIYADKPLSWEKGKLVDYNGIRFEYDGYGNRVKKGDEIFIYNVDGKLLCVNKGDDILEFIYDEDGVCGLKHGDKQYLYRENAQGDITHIYSLDGELAAQYEYDAWGNHIVKDGEGNIINSKKHIANLNPFRYRGYIYDAETELYFLKSRYYDPKTGRFISQDKVSYLDPKTINGLNLYAYCGNNPVMRIDESGCGWWGSFWKKVGNFFKKVGMVIAGAVMFVVGVIITLVGIAISLPTLLTSFIPGFGTVAGVVSGAITQFGFSLGMYGGFMMAAAFSKEIYNDMSAIGWNPFNSDEGAVLGSSKVSFYKGMPVVRTSTDRSASCGAIWLNGGADENTLKHEWGHGFQQLILGPVNYGLTIAIPSASKMGNWNNYYDAPWEALADEVGGVNRGNQGNNNAGAHLMVASIFGVWSYLFAL